MNRVKSFFVAAAFLTGAAVGNAQSLGDLLNGLGKGGDLESALGNVVEGVFTKTDISLQDIVGEYVSSGPAVTFKSDKFLQKAGGLAGAAALETKLQPYYEQYGLNGMSMSVDRDANFTLSVKRIKLSGTIEKNDGNGTFTFNIMLRGKLKIGQFIAYVEKSGKNLNLMFDATKLKEIISSVGKFSGKTIAKTMASLLDSYVGACVGFRMQYTGEASSGGVSGSGTNPGVGTSSGNDSTKSAGSGLESLRDLLKKKSKQ